MEEAQMVADSDVRGSLWRRWDLHVHTPASLHHNYSGDDVWERFVAEIEALPEEFAVLGINDYLFLDGYRKVLEYKNQGRMQNIRTFLPVLEFRIPTFGGTDSKLRRVNFHVIFSNDVTTDQIEQQFLAALARRYTLSADQKQSWSGVVTRESLEDLGRAIIESVPPERRAQYGTPLKEGFNNLNVPPEAIREALQTVYFEGRHVTAIGKTEWASVKWNDQSIAEKKDLINGAGIIFIASESASAYAKARNALRENGVSDRLLDCSDAHTWADSADKDSLGRCDTWLKADPTFRGLQHALLEFEERVYVGSEPPKLADVKKRQHKYIRSLEVRKVQGATLGEVWFDGVLEFNPGLVAVVGNKGSGKSALADIIALGGNSQQEDSFSFLNDLKFRNPREDKSVHFEGKLLWESGESEEFLLSRSPDSEDVERIRYIPQSYLEHLCNEFASEGGVSFDRELRSVIFSHIPNAERLGKRSLDSLLEYLGDETFKRINSLRGELAAVNRQIAALEREASPEYEREVSKRLNARLKELARLKKNFPSEVPKPDSDSATRKSTEELQGKIDAQRELVVELASGIESSRQALGEVLAKGATANKILARLNNLEEAVRLGKQESETDLAALDLKWEELLKFEVRTAGLKKIVSARASEEATLKKRLDPESSESDVSKLAAAGEEVVRLQNMLDAPTRRYQEYLTARKEWERSVSLVESDEEDDNSIARLQAEMDRIRDLPGQISRLERERIEVCTAIYGQLAGYREEYRELYRPVQEFIQRHRTLADSIQLTFDVRIDELNLAEHLSDWINKARSGSFQGAEEGANRLRELVRKNTFDTWEGVQAFLGELLANLKNDSRQSPPRRISTASQLKKNRSVADFYDFLFGLSYLEPRYALRMEDKELHELSPGERGLLLLLFYLLVEKSDGPLILDQPEENLDNETIHKVLVPSIKLAKYRRQLVVVTHNPNLAVVADADQVIVTSIDKKNLCRVNYNAGSLENPTVNRFVVRYLEGTLPAFMNRDQKYMRDVD